jgi:hypothetical protein
MLGADAQRAVIREWLALPADERKTKEHAVAFAMTAAHRFKFRYKGDRYQLIQIWLLNMSACHSPGRGKTRSIVMVLR